MTETGSGLIRPSLTRAELVVDQAIAYWGGDDVEALCTVSGFVLTVFAIDDELDVGPPPESVELGYRRYLPWRNQSGGRSGRGDVQRMLRRVEGAFLMGGQRTQSVDRWRQEGERMVAAMCREAEWRTGGRMPPEAEYLKNGDNSVAIPWMALTMAGMLEEVAVIEEEPAGETVAAAARACRLLNDVGSWDRERGTGTPNILPVLMAGRPGGEALSEGEAMRATRLKLGLALDRFHGLADDCDSLVVGRIRRLVEVLVSHYAMGDFPTLIPSVRKDR